MSKLQIYKGHLIERSGRGFKAYYGIFCKWFPLECAAKHWINLKIEKYEQKWRICRGAADCGIRLCFILY